MTVRVIARLDIKAPNLVKGIQLEGLRVLGKPELFARHYSNEGIDELFYQDAVASLYERNSLLDIIELASREVFIPLCVGGGLRSVEDIRTVLQSGADKVAINTAAVARPEFIAEAANTFGSSTIVAVLETIRQPDGRHLCFTDCGREPTGREAVAWAKTLASLGAGEIILTSVDREGSGQGFDLELIRQIATAVPIPVIAHGGAGTPDHVCEAVDAGADAVAVASMLHYHTIQTCDVGTDRAPSHYGHGAKGIQPSSIATIKQKMQEHGISVRPAVTAHE